MTRLSWYASKYLGSVNSLVQSLSRVRLPATPRTPAGQAPPSKAKSRNPLKPTSTESAIPSNHPIPHHPPLLPSIPPSIRVPPNEPVPCIKALEFQLQHQSPQRIPRTDLLQDGPAGPPCSPRDPQESPPTPQPKSTNSSAAPPIFQLSHPYTTLGKTIALTRRTFVGKVMSR